MTEQQLDLEQLPYPDFDDPPVVETVIGVEYSSIRGWDLRYYGLFWELVRDEYPKFEVRPPISPRSEPPDMEIVQHLALKGTPRVRCWFIDQSETRLLQLQDDRLIHNWRKDPPDTAYPRYEEAIRPRFLKEWERFLHFLNDAGLPQPSPRRWEVTYVNHFDRGREWEQPQDVRKILPWVGMADEYSRMVAGIRLLYTYRLTAFDATLRVSVQPGVRKRDEKEIVQLSLTAAGAVHDESKLMSAIDFGREVVVKMFAVLTSREMHELWRRRR